LRARIRETSIDIGGSNVKPRNVKLATAPSWNSRGLRVVGCCVVADYGSLLIATSLTSRANFDKPRSRRNLLFIAAACAIAQRKRFRRTRSRIGPASKALSSDRSGVILRRRDVVTRAGVCFIGRTCSTFRARTLLRDLSAGTTNLCLSGASAVSVSACCS